MTANRGLFVRNDGSTGTTPAESRLSLAALFVEDVPGTPRSGLLDQPTDALVVGSSTMSYTVGPCSPIINRAPDDGVYMMTLTGNSSVTTSAAPGSGARWDLIYVKQNDPDKGDPNNLPVLAVIQGTAQTNPTRPTALLPAGAYLLAEAYIPAGATSTLSTGVTVTQLWRHTALAGGITPVRNASELAEITYPVQGRRILDLTTGATRTYFAAYNPTTNRAGRVVPGWYSPGPHSVMFQWADLIITGGQVTGPESSQYTVPDKTTRHYADLFSNFGPGVILKNPGVYTVSFTTSWEYPVTNRSFIQFSVDGIVYRTSYGIGEDTAVVTATFTTTVPNTTVNFNYYANWAAPQRIARAQFATVVYHGPQGS